MKKYYNKDFYLSAYLMSAGFRLTEHTRLKNITTFVFEESEALHEEVEKYLSMNATVEPMKYGLSQRALKSVIHSSDSNSRRLNNEYSQQQKRGK